MIIKSTLVEVVTVECIRCGFRSNFLDGWEIVKGEGVYWYYLCPECSQEEE